MTIALTTVVGTIAGCLAVSLCSLSSAIALWLKPETLKWLVPNLVALAVGVLLGDAFIHLIPDAIQRHGAVSDVCLTVLIGLFGFFVLEKGVRWRHDHNVDTRPTADHILPLAKMNLIGDAMHNFVDGILIAGSFLADPVLGLTTTLAIIAHEIPQELGDVGALLRGGFTSRQAVLYNFYCSLTVLPGGDFYLAAQSGRRIFIDCAAADCRRRLHLHCRLRPDPRIARTFQPGPSRQPKRGFCLRHRLHAMHRFF